jgi:hypothetical protein
VAKCKTRGRDLHRDSSRPAHFSAARQPSYASWLMFAWGSKPRATLRAAFLAIFAIMTAKGPETSH